MSLLQRVARVVALPDASHVVSLLKQRHLEACKGARQQGWQQLLTDCGVPAMGGHPCAATAKTPIGLPTPSCLHGAAVGPPASRRLLPRSLQTSSQLGQACC